MNPGELEMILIMGLFRHTNRERFMAWEIRKLARQFGSPHVHLPVVVPLGKGTIDEIIRISADRLRHKMH